MVDYFDLRVFSVSPSIPETVFSGHELRADLLPDHGFCQILQRKEQALFGSVDASTQLNVAKVISHAQFQVAHVLSFSGFEPADGAAQFADRLPVVVGA
ncbi:hypothetical protein D3C78_1745070 [compost metagenome]